MKRTNYFLLLGLMALTIISCQHDEEMFETIEQKETLIITDQEDAIGIDPTKLILNESDAKTIGEIFIKTATNSRSGNSIKNVIPIRDNSGDISLYAVNFEFGYFHLIGNSSK
ncbi:MAG: hypothetical protein NC338_08875 [Firmicutes bacterium]|nr:hypothetical protein [Bacillota bacterium]MCM1400792.1 hypothetical protein [Bacteroides sp.]MCM1476706.1 hypothetical protein [Bacteroides sp.]